ncbi:T9SS type A sorting domain-containing protein [Saccharicrinis sp. 156]|uniref:T9SS type A sorting domain-containing protein n=1 Tax=Saccharicrinis sp. 156 TaxID=3417574 RepID=UPI003D344734
MKGLGILACLLCGFVLQRVHSQVKVEVNLDVKHKLGDVETFERRKFVNFHGTIEQNNWNTDNKIDDLIGDLLGDRDVYVGRNTGTIKWALNNNVTEDPARPGFADPASIATHGLNNRNSYAAKTWAHTYEYLDYQILCNQIFPFYPDGKTTNKGWAFSQTDTEAEPFGTASGEFLGRYIQEYYGTGGTTGQKKPSFVEITNEPLWDLVTVADEPHDLTKIFNFHSTVAKEVHKYNPDMQVGGYCAAFPDFDMDNFQRWRDRDQHFIDVAGADMDFYTIHLYDFPCIGGKAKYRKGSNIEATMDMMEQYSYMTLGHVKPLMISEYNAQTHDYNKQAWSAYRDWLKMKSTISMMMQFMERANNINYAMPFFMLKSEWAYNASVGPTSVHGARMLRRENEPTSYTGDFVYTEAIKIFDLLKDVNGTRVDSKSNNMDVLCDAYVEGNKAYVLVNNLDFIGHTLNLEISGIDATPTNIETRHLHLQGGVGGIPKLDIEQVNDLSNGVTLTAEGTYLFIYTYDEDITIDKLSEEKKYYADTYLQEIYSNNPITFNINGVDKGTYGEAMLRVGVGRDHGKTLKPTITINGKTISVPTNFRGGPQTDRDNFFGVLEIPVALADLDTDNEVVVTFPDYGGYISTVTMQVYNFSHDFRPEDVSIGKKNEYKSLSIFPNPVKDEFTVSVENSANKYDLRMYNMAGNRVFEFIDLRGEQTFNVGGLQKGVYMVTLTGNEIKRVGRLVVI